MKGIELSSIRKMFELAGRDAISFGIGEPDMQPPPHAIAAYEEALEAGHNKYCPSAGIPELREALAERARPHAPEVRASDVVVTAGSTGGLLATMLGFVNAGDEVLVPDPGFVLYAPHAKMAGGVPVRYPVRMERGFVPRIEDLEERVTGRTRALVLNNPSNPTGGCFPAKAADELAEFAERRNLLVVSDEAYDHFTYGQAHATMLGRVRNLVYVNTFSKTYAMTGWRLGWLVAEPANAEVLKRVTYHMVASPPTPTQHAALAALTGPQDFVAHMVRTFRERRDAMVERIRRIPRMHVVEPQGAFYAFPKVEAPVPDDQLALELLKAGVVVTPGSAFGPRGAGHLRLSYALGVDKIQRGMDVVEKVMANLP
jgi:aspartate aminotransferase